MQRPQLPRTDTLDDSQCGQDQDCSDRILSKTPQLASLSEWVIPYYTTLGRSEKELARLRVISGDLRFDVLWWIGQSSNSRFAWPHVLIPLVRTTS